MLLILQSCHIQHVSNIMRQSERCSTLVREGNEAFFIKVWKHLPNRRVLKLWGWWWYVTRQSEQYLLVNSERGVSKWGQRKQWTSLFIPYVSWCATTVHVDSHTSHTNPLLGDNYTFDQLPSRCFFYLVFELFK